MPHQCVRCSTFYEDGSHHIIDGCSCGGKLFFFVSKAKLEKAKQATSHLDQEQKQKIEDDVFEIIGEKSESDEPVVLDFESVNVVSPGRFELDLVNLFSTKKPLVYKLEDGKYMIDLASTFQKMKKK